MVRRLLLEAAAGFLLAGGAIEERLLSAGGARLWRRLIALSAPAII
jgi:hypothetical protein